MISFYDNDIRRANRYTAHKISEVFKMICTVFILTVAYIGFGFVAFVRDGIVARRKPTTKPEPTPVQALEVPKTQDFTTLGIRELRAFIRAAGLQESVRVAVGKNVSKCSKSELLQAIA
jgi:hypothetical protein